MQTVPRMRHHQEELIRKRHLFLSEIPSEASMYHNYMRVGCMHTGLRNWPNTIGAEKDGERHALATPDKVAIIARAFISNIIIAKVGLRNFDCGREPVAPL